MWLHVVFDLKCLVGWSLSETFKLVSINKGSLNIRKSAKVVTMSLEGGEGGM